MTDRPVSSENLRSPLSAWPVLIGFLLYGVAFIVFAIRMAQPPGWHFYVLLVIAVLLFVTLPGFYIVNPNMSRVMVLFGRYRGTVREEGFFWINPFTMKHSVSLKANNLASETIKVNDKVGNPIEIGAVVVWQVQDTAQASFDVEDYRSYVDIQVETAIRQLASRHPYDEGHDGAEGDDDEVTLRGDTDLVAGELQKALTSRLDRAGIRVLEARLSHLAYAPEIASAMLQRQQAQAVIAARRKIVDGAVGMVEHALADLSEKGVVELDDERRVTLVGNLLVVLCGQAHPQPVLNTGSLYT